MTPAEPDFVVSLTDDKTRIDVRLGPKIYSLSPSKAFCFAHALLCRRKYEEAAQVCDARFSRRTAGRGLASCLRTAKPG